MERSTIEAPERRALLDLARRAIAAKLAGAAEPPIPDLPIAQQRRGAFVSLHENGGTLRGCIGHVTSDRPLGEVVRQVAVSAARNDPRFPPVTPEELADLHIEISVLSEPVPVDLAQRARLVIGRDGVLLRSGSTHAVLLPQVATEHRLGPEAFLDAVCQKAGLRPGSWREPGMQVFTFTADVLVE